MADYLLLLRRILEEGKVAYPHGKEIRELMHMPLDVEPMQPFYSFKGSRDLDFILAYWFRELAWYFSGERNAEYIKTQARLWNLIINPDGTLNSNYGYLVFYNRTAHPSLGLGPETQSYMQRPSHYVMTPFDWALHCLKEDQYSRQAIMTYNTGGFNFEGNKDYICTQHQSFFIREDQLDCFIALRSSDAIYGLTYNMPWWSLVHQQLYLSLLGRYPDLKMGRIRVTIYSAHIYKQHYELVKNLIDAEYRLHSMTLLQTIPTGMSLEWYLGNLPHYIEIK